jgi:DNA polymerase-3 subunit chi
VTEVTFYTFAGDPLDVARRLAIKAWSSGKQVLLHCTDPARTAAIDRLLWTTPALGFVPHCLDSAAVAAETPIVLGSNADALARADVIVNLDDAWPPAFARFERLLEIVGTDEDAREKGRARYRFYQSRGYALQTHDLRTRA